jgi:enamine deaminase RidA (YjgF/YER057c/UK114 family)
VKQVSTVTVCRVGIDDRLAELGVALPDLYAPPPPLAAVIVHDRIARTSGQLPRADGTLQFVGRLGDDVSVEQGQQAARLCVLNGLAALAHALGSLDAIERVLHVTGFVACAPGFADQPAVVDGASALLADVFGERGQHTRSAIGVAALPRGAAVEVELTVAVRPPT